MKKTILFLLCLLFISELINSQTIQKLDSVHLFSWDTNNAEWRHNTREILNYENFGNKETKYLRLNLSNSNWDNFYQTLNTYDADNNLTEKIFQTWDSDATTWRNGSKDVINYSGNQKSSEFYYTYFSDKWNEKSNTKYTYNSGKLAEELSQKNNTTFTAMVNNIKLKYIYNGNFLIERVKQKWLDYASIWENDEKIIYEYFGENISKESTVSWSVSQQDWGASGYKETNYSYNSNNLISESIASLRIISNSVVEYKGTDKYNYTYSTNQVIATHQQKKLTGDDGWKNYAQQIRKTNADDSLTEHIYQNWNTELNNWKPYLRIVYFWSDVETDFTLSLEESVPEKIVLSIFPIPVKNKLNIHFSKKIEVHSTLFFYDLNGKEILKKTIPPTNQKTVVEIPKISGSLFFLKITNKFGSNTYKIVTN